MGSNVQSTSSSTQRLRSRALWALLVGAVGLSATLVALVQYVGSGVVSIVPGRDPLTGPAALASLFFLFIGSAAFAVSGAVMRWRAKRRGAA